MTAPTISPAQEIADLLQETGGDAKAAFQLYLDRTAESDAVPVVKRSSKDARKAEHARAIENFDLDYLIDIQTRAGAIVDKVTANELKAGLDADPTISDTLAEAIARELQDEKLITEFIEARRDQIKKAVFAHITAEAKAKGVPLPEYSNGAIVVEALGVQLERYGAGMKTPTVNLVTLQHHLSPELYAQVVSTVRVEEKIIPAHTESHLDREAVVALSHTHPEILLAVQQSLESEGMKDGSFTLHNTPARKS